MNRYDAVLFIGFGGPEKSQDILPFLEGISARLPAGRQGRGIPPERLLNVAHHYEAIGGKSPINEITRRQAEGLQKALQELGDPIPVFIGQRNWHPFLKETLAAMTAQGIKRAIGFPTAAHRCEASLERYINAAEEARRTVGESAPVIDYVEPWFDHPLFIEAICKRVKEALSSPTRGEEISWIFTAHSIPCGMAKDSAYVQELRRTAELVSQTLGRREWKLAYSSRSGHPRDPWLEPDVSRAIRQEASRGVKEILFIPIGFIADHVEILFDLDVEAQETAKTCGVRLRRSQTVGEHPRFVQMMAEVVRDRMSRPEKREQRSSKAAPYPGCFCFPDSPNPPCRP